MRPKTKTVITLGFTAVIGLTVALTLLGVVRIHDSVMHTEAVVEQDNTKMRLVTQMRTTARERTLSLHKMIVLTDPFARDEEWLHFNALGGAFIEARLQLKELALSPAEQDLLARQATLSDQVAPLQTQIAGLALEGDTETAKRMLLDSAIPGQDRTFAVISDLLNYLQTNSENTLRHAKQDYQRALTWMLLLAGAGISLGIVVAVFVIARTTDAERGLFQEKERAQITLHSIGDGVITTDAAGRIEQMNATAEGLTGWRQEEARGRVLLEIFQLVRENDHAAVPDPIPQVLASGRTVQSERDQVLVRADGREFAIEHTASPVYDRWLNRLTGIVLVFRDVTEMRALSRQLGYQAAHDNLTGLLNRREFEARLEQLLTLEGHAGQEHWLCYVDLDQFKVINDTCGHFAGDELLKQIADGISLNVRDTDVVARMGGDEFAILLRHCPAVDAERIVERIRDAIQQLRFAWEQKTFSCSASIGMVPLNMERGSPYDLLSAADTACYVAKDEGRNRVHIYHHGDHVQARHEGEMQWVHRINRALEENRFVLFYQRIEPLQSRPSGMRCELLLRMVDEDGEIVPPMAFIPAAERYNLMGQIDRWVVRRALSTFGDLAAQTGAVECDFSINLSGQSLCDDSFLPLITQQIEQSGWPPERICFEITETAAIANLSRATRFIQALSAQGCRFALDDFGSGLSSFGYLKNLPVNFLKIDGSFVRDISHDPMDFALVESINQIGHVVGIETIAEYVTGPKVMEMLRRIGVDHAQGHWIHAPAPLAELLEQLRRMPRRATGA